MLQVASKIRFISVKNKTVVCCFCAVTFGRDVKECIEQRYIAFKSWC